MTRAEVDCSYVCLQLRLLVSKSVALSSFLASSSLESHYVPLGIRIKWFNLFCYRFYTFANMK